ncbi:hypothetical protein, partial [Peribacillus simplex]|uniref:hypothetical protein n=1 Tax=Peribacillus simplex TaxID=1478 RepID=UPI003D26522B
LDRVMCNIFKKVGRSISLYLVPIQESAYSGRAVSQYANNSHSLKDRLFIGKKSKYPIKVESGNSYAGTKVR